jgi:hypothetical protein
MSTAPNPAEVERIIVSDNEGNYYLLSRAALEQARVEGDQKAEVQKLVDSHADVTGFSEPSPQITQPLNVFGKQLLVKGTCYCSFAGCTTFDPSTRVVNPPR